MKMILFLCNFVLPLTQKAAVGLIMILICLAEIHNNRDEIMWSPLTIDAVLPTISTLISKNCLSPSSKDLKLATLTMVMSILFYLLQ